jgi:hypothetical protein
MTFNIEEEQNDLYIDNDAWNDLCAIYGYNPYELLAETVDDLDHNEKVWIELNVVKRWLKNNE